MREQIMKKSSSLYKALAGIIVGISIPYTTFGSQTLECDVVIIGGGPAGVHTAFRLAQNPPNGISRKKICLFEKNDYLGGRMIDKPVGKNNAITGTAAYRMYNNHSTYALCNELGVPLETQESFDKLKVLNKPNNNASYSGNWFAYSAGAFLPAFNNIPYPSDDDVFFKMMCGPQVPKTAVPGGGLRPNYAGVAGIKNMNPLEYLKFSVGNDQNAVNYATQLYRFRSDFQVNYDAIDYMEYLVEDWASDGNYYYPVPGYSAMIKKMENKILDKANDNSPAGANAGKIKLKETVKSVIKNSKGGYDVKTTNYDVKAKIVVIATEASAIKKMTDRKENESCSSSSRDMIHRIISQTEYKNITSASALTVTHQWSKKWWNDDLRYTGPNLLGDQLSGPGTIKRIETTYKTPAGYSINMSELPVIPYHDSIFVTRTVYTDDIPQTVKWSQLYSSQGESGVNAQVIASLNKLLPNVFTSANLNDYKPNANNNLPKIVKTAVTYVPNSWFGLKEGAYKDGVTHKTIFEWATKPIPGEKVYLAGDAYYPSYGWSASAITTSAHLLNERFGMNLNLYLFPRVTCLPDGNLDFDHIEDPSPTMQ